jgi:hypothetical protein
MCWTGSNWDDLHAFASDAVITGRGCEVPINGVFKVVNTGDYIVKSSTRTEIVDKDLFLENYGLIEVD